MTALRIGIISFAHVHAPSYARVLSQAPSLGLAPLDFVGIWDDDATRGMAAAESFRTRFFPDLAGLLQDVNAVVITSPNTHHRRHVEAAAEAGVAVLCEKPLATTHEDLDACVQSCERAKVPLMTAFPVRFSPQVQEAASAVRSGRIGTVLAISGANNGRMPGGWFADPALSGGGCLMDHVVHVADLIRWMTGQEIVEVYAEAGPLLRGLPVEDVGMLSLRLESGAIAAIDSSWSRPDGYPTWGGLDLRIVGSTGAIDVDAFARRMPLAGDRDHPLRLESYEPDLDARMIEAFVQALSSGGPVPITGEDGRRAAEVALAALRSARSHEVVAVASPAS